MKIQEFKMYSKEINRRDNIIVALTLIILSAIVQFIFQ